MLPPLSMDMDGVICTPFLGTNIAISRKLGLPPLPASVGERGAENRRVYAKVRRRVELVRYMGRKPLPDVRAGLEALVQVRRPVLVTGRSSFARQLIRRWLERYDLARFFDDVLPNHTNLVGAHFKLWTAQRLGHVEHVDDDGSVAHFMASNGVRVFLRDWPRNRQLPYPPGVTVYHRLVEVAEKLA
ncbi:MAG TPA: hypothetical protein VK009_23495 [Chloroflexota bacterium]|nr:hypothetical protein [Chloroflexota bacterium]